MLTIYKASAGSGKTYTLAYRYIKMLLGVKRRHSDGEEYYVLNLKKYLGDIPEDRRAHTHILAITFTNKATAEMKTRIIDELSALARMPRPGEDDCAYAKDLMGEYGCTRDELARVARRSLAALLNDYSRFNVSTIDSFFQTILRSFAREVERQGDFRLELDNMYVLGSALSMLFDDLNDGLLSSTGPVGTWLNVSAGERMRDGDDFNPFNRSGGMYAGILSGLKKKFNETYEAHADEIRAYMADPGRLDLFAAELTQAMDNLISLGIKRCVTMHDDLVAKGFGFDRLTRNLRNLIDKSHTDGLTYNTSRTPNYIRSLINRETEGLFLRTQRGQTEPTPAAYDVLYDWFDDMEVLAARRNAMAVILDSLDTLKAHAYMDAYIERFRHENNLILLSETNNLLDKIIDKDDAPFIYERVGVELRNFLIDEFQDTSRLQWSNLRPLISGAHGERHDSLIIGDVKQSIYRWRGGDPTLLSHSVANSDFPVGHEVRGELPKENTNYRSAHDIVRLNNTLFDVIARLYAIAGYDGVTQELAGKTEKLTSWIEIADLTADNLAEHIDRYLTDSQIAKLGVATTDAETVALERCGSLILDQHERGYRWSDIVILCRENKNVAKTIEYLMNNFPAIRVTSDEALMLRNSKAVKMIVGVMEMIDTGSLMQQDAEAPVSAAYMHPRSDSKVLIDRFGYFIGHGYSPDTALDMALDPAVETVDTDSCSTSLSADMQHIRDLAPGNLISLVEAIIERKINPQLRVDEMAYVAAFVDLVVDYSTNFNPSLHGFLQYWETHRDKATIASSADQDAVTVMTVHKAKGLQWDCVHIPLMSWDLTPSVGSMWYTLDDLTEIPSDIRPPLVYLRGNAVLAKPGSPVQRQAVESVKSQTEDNLNVAYVAFTRAVRELHIDMVPAPKNESGKLSEAVRNGLAVATSTDNNLRIDIHGHVDSLGNLEIGGPTVPDKSADESGTVETLGAYPVEFSQLNRRVASLDDLVTSACATDPALGNAGDDKDSRVMIDDERRREAARHGNNLHNILSRMLCVGDLDKALGSRVYRDGEDARYRAILTRAFDEGGELVASWFDPAGGRILTEQPIYEPVRGESFRPDRLVWHADGTIDVVDYKFTAEIEEAHSMQVRGYVNLLKSMGYDRVNGYLWYPEMGRIVSV